MRRSLPLPLCLVAAAQLAAQTPTLLFTDIGSGAIDKLGYSIRSAGDLNADGIPDYIYSAPFTDLPGRTNAGIVRVRSGADHSLLFEFLGDARQDEYGYTVTAAGDANGDGYDDFLITQLIGSRQFQGSAEIHSGHDGTILQQLYGNQIAYDYFGVGGSGVGDVNADGYDDVAVGAPASDVTAYASGELTVFSGVDGSVLLNIPGPANGDRLGWFVDGAGDVNGDGHADIIAGAPTSDGPGGVDSGAAYVYSGFDGSVLYSVFGDAPNDQLGWAVSRAGDVNKDGFDDFLVGSPLNDAAGTDAGKAQLFSGADGSLLHTIFGDLAGDNMGWCVRNIGDVDGDGYGDYGAGAYLADTAGLVDNGMARLFSGQFQTELWTFEGVSNNAQMGFSFGTAGDLDADGFDDVLLGSPFEDIGGGVEAGRIYVYSLPHPTTSPPRMYDRGAGCPGSDGKQPRADVFGRAALGDSYGVSLRGALGSAPAVLNLGLSTDVDLGAGAPSCRLLTTPLFTATLMTGADGLVSLPLFTTVPTNPAFVGIELHHQWIIVDPSNNLFGLSLSDDAIVIIGQ